MRDRRWPWRWQPIVPVKSTGRFGCRRLDDDRDEAYGVPPHSLEQKMALTAGQRARTRNFKLSAPNQHINARRTEAMSRIRGVIGLAAAIVFAVACSSGSTGSTSSPSASTGGSNLHFYFVTHGDNGTFWSVVQKGEKQAAADLGVSVNYQGSNNDDTQECQFISAAVTAKPDGLVVSPHSQTVLDCAKQAAAGGIPLILINNCGTTASGQSYIAYSGAITCVGQPETAAGTQAGIRLKADGGTKLLCVI